MTIISVQADSNEFRFGTQSLRVTTGDTGDNALYPTNDVTVEPNLAYTFSVYVKTNVALTGGSLYLWICGPGTTTPALFASDALTDSTAYEDSVEGWSRMSVTFTAPDGVLSIRPVIKYDGSTLGEVFYLDGTKFEKGDVASVWAQNIVSRQLVLDQGAVQVDASEGGLLRLRGALGGARDTISLGDQGLVFGGDAEILSPVTGQISMPRLRLTSTDDVTVTSTTHPFQIGADASQNVAFDNNEIQARNNGEVADLILQLEGGRALINGLRLHGAGTSFPASPSTYDHWFRTDLGLWFFYDGTRWVTVAVYEMPMPQLDNLSATSTDVVRIATPWLRGGSDIWIEAVTHTFHVASGSALSGSHKWVVTVKKMAVTTGALTVFATFNVDSGSSAVWRQSTPLDINALQNSGTTHIMWTLSATKTGTPGNFYTYSTVSYRIVAT